MKKALNLMLAYLITLLVGVSLGTVLYSFYINVLKYVAGTEIAFFAKNDMMYSLFYILFCSLIVVLPFISYYRIRHPGGVPQIIAFVILAILTWGLFIPGVYKLSEKYKTDYYEAEESVPLSKGYFRKVDDKVYYFTDDFWTTEQDVRKADAVVIDLNAKGNDVIYKTVSEDPLHPLFRCAAPYRDILLKNTMESYDFPFRISFMNIIRDNINSISEGVLRFIGYLSLGLALASVFSLTNVFDWKLLNTLLISVTSVLILIINSIPSFFGLDILQGKMGNNGFIRAFSKLGNEPLVIFLNFLLALIFIVIGVVRFFVKRHAAKGR